MMLRLLSLGLGGLLLLTAQSQVSAAAGFWRSSPQTSAYQNYRWRPMGAAPAVYRLQDQHGHRHVATPWQGMGYRWRPMRADKLLRSGHRPTLRIGSPVAHGVQPAHRFTWRQPAQRMAAMPPARFRPGFLPYRASMIHPGHRVDWRGFGPATVQRPPSYLYHYALHPRSVAPMHGWPLRPGYNESRPAVAHKAAANKPQIRPTARKRLFDQHWYAALSGNRGPLWGPGVVYRTPLPAPGYRFRPRSAQVLAAGYPMQYFAKGQRLRPWQRWANTGPRTADHAYGGGWWYNPPLRKQKLFQSVPKESSYPTGERYAWLDPDEGGVVGVFALDDGSGSEQWLFR